MLATSGYSQGIWGMFCYQRDYTDWVLILLHVQLAIAAFITLDVQDVSQGLWKQTSCLKSQTEMKQQKDIGTSYLGNDRNSLKHFQSGN